jgi:hypothetical protein
MSVSLGTSTNIYIDPGSNRKVVKTSSGKLVAFADLGNGAGNRIKYKTSSDGGVTWDGAWTVAYDDYNVLYFDVYIDSNDDILLAMVNRGADLLYNLLFRRLAWNGSSWDNEAVATLRHASDVLQCSITMRSNGEIWASTYSGSSIRAYYSTDDVVWTEQSFAIDATAISGCQSLIPHGSNIWCVTIERDSGFTTYLRVREYTSSWGAPTLISTSIVTSVQALGTGKIDDNNIYVAGRYVSGIVVFYWNGVTWDGGTTIGSASSDLNPSISNVGNFPVVVWQLQVDATHKKIVYRKYNGVVWEALVEITGGATNDTYPTTMIVHSTSLLVMWQTGVASPYTIYFESLPLVASTQKTITSDVHFKATDIDELITSDVYFKAENQQIITSDVYFIPHRETIISNVHFKGVDIQETILSDVKFVLESMSDINNKFNIIKQVFVNITNKFNSAIRVLSDINSYFNMIISSLSDINNDFRTHKRTLNDISNDVRFLKSWLVPGIAGFQSLGKEYIRVYINSVEQTDVDVDSISIFKTVNSEHTASFELARAYDSSKPTDGAEVEIKYHTWTLYVGYIVSINPSDTPESMVINCSNDYWKQNRENSYFHVGHEPQDNKELYYDTIHDALVAEFSWNVDIGNFVPKTIDCFSIGKSDAITNLIESCGNYAWFYDVDGTKKLRTAENGNIITLDRQIIGNNLKLFDALSHSFSEDSLNVINKFRVQMGDKVIRTFNTTGGNRQYTGYNYSTFQGYLSPAWNSSYEHIARPGGYAYGINHPDPSNTSAYAKVGKIWNIPYIDTEISSWSDRYPPYIEVITSGSIYGAPAGVLRDGFTIDFEKRQVTFNEPILLYQTNTYGEVTAVRAPILKLFVFKKNYYTVTETPGDDPETDIANPLMFFTDKVGTYPTTILKDLDLSDLTIQEGGNYIDDEGNLQVIPSWDDTDFAEDYAYWQLSKTKEKKITGRVVVTLDTICYNAIDLAKRIFINGITDSAMNINSLSYDIANFTVTIEIENHQYYKRTVSLQSRGE